MTERRILLPTDLNPPATNRGTVEEGAIYRDHDDGIVFRVREVRGTDPESVVAVEVLDEAIETYRTRREISDGIDSGAIEPADDVEHGDFEGEDPGVPMYELDSDTSDLLKYLAVGLAAAFVTAAALPATRIFAVLAVKLAIPLAVLAVAAYFVYLNLQEEGDGG